MEYMCANFEYEIVVLMSTYNGERYLKTQIESILRQEGVKTYILVRDDGSTDRTIAILEEYKKANKLDWYSGENLRPAKSFMNLIRHAPTSKFYAFSDQDDYWLPQKLKVAIEHLNKLDSNKPLLYYGVTTLVDDKLRVINQCKEKNKFTSFRQAVISSNATGCTMVFNSKLKDMINRYEPTYQIMHDGWLHKVCLAVDGDVFFDQKSYILYRQHGNNVVGGTTSFSKRWKRRIETIKNDPCARSRGIRELYMGYASLMPTENVKICESIIKYHDNLIFKIRLLFNFNIRSSNKRIDIIYRIAVLLGKF